MKNKQKTVRLVVSYPADFFFSNCPDSKIEKAVGTECDGSGMGMGYRDLNWSEFPKSKVASVKTKLKKLKVYGLFVESY